MKNTLETENQRSVSLETFAIRGLEMDRSNIASIPNWDQSNQVIPNSVSPNYIIDLSGNTVTPNIAQVSWWTDFRAPIKPHRKSDQSAISEETKLEKKFHTLSKEWKSSTGTRSLLASVVTHPAYLEIISYGEKMIPHILLDLQKEPNHWFIALYIMAGRFSPVKQEDVGNIKKMTEAWLEWGRRNGKLK